MDTVINEINEWLRNPVASDPEEAIAITSKQIETVSDILANSIDLKATYGPLLGKLKALQKRLLALELKDWMAIENGHIAIGHRPSAKLITDLKLQGTTHILTLLSEKEGANETEKLTKKENLQWLWFSMHSANAPDPARMEELKKLFNTMHKALQHKAKIYIHCSAGIHRTGMISYTFLRYIQLSQEEAEDKLMNLRKETADGVGAHRKSWGEAMLKIL